MVRLSGIFRLVAGHRRATELRVVPNARPIFAVDKRWASSSSSARCFSSVQKRMGGFSLKNATGHNRLAAIHIGI